MRQVLRVWLKAGRGADGAVQLRAVLCGDLVNTTQPEGDAAAACGPVCVLPTAHRLRLRCRGKGSRSRSVL